MAILGPYSGDQNQLASYLYGMHWKGMKGFKIIQGKSNYKHRFGGETWKVPICKNCQEPYHQIFTFDLDDPRLRELKTEGLDELPIVSCLNCSTVWEPQVFKIDPINKEIKIVIINDKQEWTQDEQYKIPVPFPEVNMNLVEMEEEDVPINSDFYYNILDLFGEQYICRLLGAPVYVHAPIDRECPICKKEMQYVAMVGSQSYNVENLIEGVDFFIGEMNLYYLLCKDCMIIKTECQGS